ncbi:MAG: RpiB/LacA/LacB family sugar-phosphate isomerase [Patescibacteria group bacterium]
MKVYLGTDHAGFKLKEEIKAFLKAEGHQVYDEGAFEFEAGDDYPDFIDIVAKQVASDPDNNFGIVFGASGQGEAMCANRYKHIRAAVFYGGADEIIKLSREHNNANILSLGAKFLDHDLTKHSVKLWLETKFSGEDRHIRRNAKIDYKVPAENEF